MKKFLITLFLSAILVSCAGPRQAVTPTPYPSIEESASTSWDYSTGPLIDTSIEICEPISVDGMYIEDAQAGQPRTYNNPALGKIETITMDKTCDFTVSNIYMMSDEEQTKYMNMAKQVCIARSWGAEEFVDGAVIVCNSVPVVTIVENVSELIGKTVSLWRIYYIGDTPDALQPLSNSEGIYTMPGTTGTLLGIESTTYTVETDQGVLNFDANATYLAVP